MNLYNNFFFFFLLLLLSALCRVLIAWRSFSQKQKVLNALRQKVACRVNERRQQEAFRVWRGAYLATKEAEAKRKEAALLTRYEHTY